MIICILKTIDIRKIFSFTKFDFEQLFNQKFCQNTCNLVVAKGVLLHSKHYTMGTDYYEYVYLISSQSNNKI